MEQPDYRRIHELEYELGFRDDPPPSRAASAATVSAVLKEVWTDAPGRVIEYTPAHERRIATARRIAERHGL